MAETVSEAHDLCPRFSQESSATMVHAPGILRIGGAAYFVWAYLPNGGVVYMSGADNCDRPLQGCLYGIKQVIVSTRIVVQVLLAIALPAWR